MGVNITVVETPALAFVRRAHDVKRKTTTTTISRNMFRRRLCEVPVPLFVEQKTNDVYDECETKGPTLLTYSNRICIVVVVVVVIFD